MKNSRLLVKIKEPGKVPFLLYLFPNIVRPIPLNGRVIKGNKINKRLYFILKHGIMLSLNNREG